MGTEVRTCLNDVLNADGMLNEFTVGRTYSDYEDDPLFRSAMERQFGITVESISRLAKIDELTAARITGYRRITSFRNILIHEYTSVDNQVVWMRFSIDCPYLSLG